MAVGWKRVFLLIVAVLMAAIIFAPSVFVASDSGQVSIVIGSIWKTAATQIKTVTSNVILPVVDYVLAILPLVKLVMAYFDYRKYGEFDPAPVAILLLGLVFTITAPTYIWDILGIWKRKELKLWDVGV